MAGVAIHVSFRGLLLFYSKFADQLIIHDAVVAAVSVNNLPVLIDNEHCRDAVYFVSIRNLLFWVEKNGEVHLLRAGKIHGIFGVFVDAYGENLEVVRSGM